MTAVMAKRCVKRGKVMCSCGTEIGVYKGHAGNRLQVHSTPAGAVCAMSQMYVTDFEAAVANVSVAEPPETGNGDIF